MIATIKDIQEKLKAAEYKNEEHIRFSLVARLLQEIGWNIWDPYEVRTEFKLDGKEDGNGIDIVLLLDHPTPLICLNIKAPGKLSVDLESSEAEMDDCDHIKGSLFTVITDGGIWRFYLSSAAGAFKERHFREINFLTTSADVLEKELKFLFGKESLKSKTVIDEVDKYHRFMQVLRGVQGSFVSGKQLTKEQSDHFLSEALLGLLQLHGFEVSMHKVQEFLKVLRNPSSIPSASTTKDVTPVQESVTQFEMVYQNITANAVLLGKKLKVLFGSQANLHVDESLRFKEIREELIQNGVLRREGNVYKFDQDYHFHNPEVAADIIAGRSVSGLGFWKDEKGREMYDLHYKYGLIKVR